ncbi:MAG: DUF4142 domain-containing protein [Candidatus Eremiobacteraeota bacterium]|nr:DUF4142 domain-containing protein [Candidatus Eremiobacteraeota bacterium]
MPLRRIGLVAAFTAAAILFSAPAHADVRTVPPATMQFAAFAAVAPMDHRFVMKAARGGNAEISMARLALKKSTNASVTIFARRMIRDHSAAAANLASIVAAMGGPTLPTSLSQADAAMRAALTQLAGAEFDTTYLKGQVAGHRKMATLMQSETTSGANAALRSFASATLPTVRMHLSMAQKRLSTLSNGR